MIVIENECRVMSDCGKMVHRKGEPPHIAYNKIGCSSNAKPEDFEEVDRSDFEAANEYLSRRQAYKKQLVALIRNKYDADDETAILRQRDTKPEEFDEYNAFVEECKETARDSVASLTMNEIHLINALQ